MTINQSKKRIRNSNQSLYLLLVMVVLFSLPAQAQLSRLKFSNKYKIESIDPLSLREVKGAVQVTLRNDTTTFTMSDITGVIYKKGKPFVQGQADPVRVPAGNSTVRVTGVAALCPGISLWTVLGCLFGFDIEDYTADVSMVITDAAGHTRQLDKKGVSVAAILRNRHKK